MVNRTKYNAGRKKTLSAFLLYALVLRHAPKVMESLKGKRGL